MRRPALIDIGPKFRGLNIQPSSHSSGRVFRVHAVPPSLQERISAVLREQDISAAGLARIAKVTRSLVSQWLNGPSKTMSYEPAKNISAAYGYAVDWLMDGSGSKMATTGTAAPQAQITAKTPDEAEILLEYRKLTPSWKQAVRSIVKAATGSPHPTPRAAAAALEEGSLLGRRRPLDKPSGQTDKKKRSRAS